MVFEVKKRDLMGRIGKIKTKSGSIETPILLPVINPLKLTIPPSKMRSEFKVTSIITNAYILRKKCYEKVVSQGIHNFLNFDGPIMTDSGAYQLLVYGEVDISPEEVIGFQEKIGSDICVFLDVPTGNTSNYSLAKKTVEDTLKRAIQCIEIRSKENVLWVGPIQGGEFTELVEYSAEQMGKLPFDIYAIGSPTQFLEQYNYSKIVEMIVNAKRHLPLNKPVHLFGAGHPMILPLAVALGCDIFDSASYVLYAEGGRYITPRGTKRLSDLKETLCLCPICSKYTPSEINSSDKNLKIKLLSEHNLYITLNEINNIKYAIREGRLWEYIEMSCRSHPSIYEAFQTLKNYQDYLEEGTPTSKKRALLWLSEETANRPEIKRHIAKIEYLKIPWGPKVLLILPESKNKPSIRSRLHSQILKFIAEDPATLKNMQIITLSKMFGVIPIELEEFYPLSQHLTQQTVSERQIQLIKATLKGFIKKHGFTTIILLNDQLQYGDAIKEFLASEEQLKMAEALKIFTFEKSDNNLLEKLKKIRNYIC